MVTGSRVKIGYQTCLKLLRAGCTVIATSRFPNAACLNYTKEEDFEDFRSRLHVYGLDLRDVAGVEAFTAFIKLDYKRVDILINNAGYFYEPVEKIEGSTLNFAEEMKMIDICAVGPLRVTNAFYNANLLKPNKSVIAMITSQGGSIDWRTTQNPEGGDYGHHMSKAAANMMGVLVAQEMKKVRMG